MDRLKKWLREEKGQDVPWLCPTTWRHGFCTHLLLAGVDAVTVSILMGHRDASMVAKVYQHLTHNQDYLLGQLRRVEEES